MLSRGLDIKHINNISYISYIQYCCQPNWKKDSVCINPGCWHLWSSWGLFLTSSQMCHRLSFKHNTIVPIDSIVLLLILHFKDRVSVHQWIGDLFTLPLRPADLMKILSGRLSAERFRFRVTLWGYSLGLCWQQTDKWHFVEHLLFVTSCG